VRERREGHGSEAAPADSSEIRIEGVTRRYPGALALDDVSLTVRDRECLVLLGPSGCGKTTLLRLLAGFEAPDAGTISIGGRDMTGVPPGRRGMAMVFQSYALFPHLTVSENIAFGLRMRRLERGEVGRRVAGAAEQLQITDLLARFPSDLSGGQRQRVAVARALVTRPAVILMDEPLSSLDAMLREQVRGQLKHLLREVRTTTVYVTHDQAEALSIGDRTAVMREGRILQCDTPMTIYDRPSDIFVAQFIGSPPMNVLSGRMGRREVVIEGRQVPLAAQDGYPVGEEVMVGVRAENIRVGHEWESGALQAEVRIVEPLGSHLVLTLALGGQTLKVQAGPEFVVESGDRVWLRFETIALRLLGRARHR
jgi:multiple sugar transport system ATP-binding protein